MFTELVNLIFWSVALLLFSSLLDRMWSYSLVRWIYVVFAAPGIIVHELCHLGACLLTGAKVTKVVLISKEGGSVTHGRPRWGFLGQTMVSMAPFIGVPLVLVVVGLLFDLVPFFHCDMTWGHRPGWDVGSMLIGTMGSAFDLIWDNLVGNRSVWFLLYLYLAASLTVALAPSKQDLRNSWVGLSVLLFLAASWALVNDWFLSDLGWKGPVARLLIDILGWIVALGLVMCLLGLLIGLPFFLLRLFLKRKRRS